MRFYLLVGLLFCIAISGCRQQTEQPGGELSKEGQDPLQNALEKLDEQITQSPSNDSLYNLRADLFLKMEGFDEAIADLETAMKLDSSKALYPLKLADVYFNYGRSRKAYNILTAASYQFKDNQNLQKKLVEYQIILKKNEEAINKLQELLKEDRHNPELYFLMGINFQDVGDEDRAISAFQMAVDKDSDFVDAWMMLGYIYDQRNDPIAERFFQNAIDSDPNFVDGYLAKGNFYGNQGDFGQAVETFKLINEKFGPMKDAMYNIGLAYVQMDSLGKAQEHFDYCLKLAPDYVKAHYYMAYVLEKQGEIEQAKNYYQQTLSFDPDMKRASDALRRLSNK